MKRQKFSNIYDLLDSKPKNISQLLGEFGEYVYRSYCRQQQLDGYNIPLNMVMRA